MKGFPKHLNSKNDYIYISEHFPEEQWKPYWQDLLTERFRWITTGTLKKKSDGVTDDTHKVETLKEINPESNEEVTVYVQQEYKENPSSNFWRLGFTLEEVQEKLGITEEGAEE